VQPHSFLDEPEGLLVLGDFGGSMAHCSYSVCMNLGCLVRHPQPGYASAPWFLVNCGHR
jgi:hypothetical protein